MDIKLIATDMDGTLLSSDKKLTERTIRALTEADQRGIHVVLATGRTFQGLDAYTKILPFVRYYITVNGSYVWDAKADTALYSATIPIERGIEIISYLKKYETMNDCYIDGQGWIDQRYLDNIHDYIADEEVVRLVRYTRIGLEDYLGHVRQLGRGIQKVQLYFSDLDKRSLAIQELQSAFGDIAVTWSLPNNVELNIAAANKGRALKVLCEHLNIDIRDAIAFGDGLNDRTMLLEAGYSVAMENGIEDIKSVADYVTDNNDEEGVARAIEKLVLRHRARRLAGNDWIVFS